MKSKVKDHDGHYYYNEFMDDDNDNNDDNDDNDNNDNDDGNDFDDGGSDD